MLISTRLVHLVFFKLCRSKIYRKQLCLMRSHRPVKVRTGKKYKGHLTPESSFESPLFK